MSNDSFWSRLRLAILAVTGRDHPQDDGPLFRYHARESISGLDGVTPFDHFGLSPAHLPDGWAFDSNGAIRPWMKVPSAAAPHGRAAAVPVVPYNDDGDFTPLGATRPLLPVNGVLGRWHTYHSTDLTSAASDDFEDRNSVAMAAAPSGTFWQVGHWAIGLACTNTSPTDALMVQAAINGKTSQEVLASPVFVTADAAPAAVAMTAGHVTASGWSGRAAKTATEIIQLTTTTLAGTVGTLRCFAAITARQVA